ncbi:hypothetical protein LABALGNA3A7_05440 [Dellaglioa algida]|nr:hypothetical protein LABALGNA3A7_05440 [Dellaglioa algida]
MLERLKMLNAEEAYSHTKNKTEDEVQVGLMRAIIQMASIGLTSLQFRSGIYYDFIVNHHIELTWLGYEVSSESTFNPVGECTYQMTSISWENPFNFNLPPFEFKEKKHMWKLFGKRD